MKQNNKEEGIFFFALHSVVLFWRSNKCWSEWLVSLFLSLSYLKGNRVKSSTQHAEENKPRSVSWLVFRRNVAAFVLVYGVVKTFELQLQQEEEQESRLLLSSLYPSYMVELTRIGRWYDLKGPFLECAKMMVGAHRGLILRLKALPSSPLHPLENLPLVAHRWAS